MDAGLFFGIVYAAGALITMILYDVREYKQNKREKPEMTFWGALLESTHSPCCVGAGWPITLPFLLKEIASDTPESKTDTKE